jgi:integrase
MLKQRGGVWQIDIAHPTEGRLRVSTGYRIEQQVLAELRHKEMELMVVKGASVEAIKAVLRLSAVAAPRERSQPMPLLSSVPTHRQPVYRGGISIGALFELALPVIYMEHKSLRSVQTNYRMVCKHFGEDCDVREIDTEACDDFITACRKRRWIAKGSERRLSGKTINRYMSVLSKLLRFAKDRHYIAEMPKIATQKERAGRVRYLTPDEEQRVLASFAASSHPWDTIMCDLVAVILDTGLRHGEAYRIRDMDVNLSGNTLSVWESKSDRPRTVPLTTRAHAILRRRLNQSGYVFGDLSEGGRDPGVALYRAITRWNLMKRRIGFAGDKEFVIHALRHTTCTRLFQAGRDPRRIQTFLGHRSIVTTLKYEHMGPESLKGMEQALEPQLVTTSKEPSSS